MSALEQTAYRLDAYCKRLGEINTPTSSIANTNHFLSQRVNLETLKKDDHIEFVLHSNIMYVNEFTELCCAKEIAKRVS